MPKKKYRMKLPTLTILILLLIPSFVYAGAAGEYQYPKVTLELKGNAIVLKQKDNIYTYPSSNKGEYAGIKKLLREDVNSDGKEEYILAVQLEGVKFVKDGRVDDMPKFPYGVVLIAEQRGDKLDIQSQMVVGDCEPDFELADVNKDGIKDVIAIGWNLMQWSQLKIVSWQENKYVFLWDRGGCEAVEQSFGINDNGDAQIKVGLPYYGEDRDWFDAHEWETWVWDGEKFALKGGNNK